jgi:hypothetical protein
MRQHARASLTGRRKRLRPLLWPPFAALAVATVALVAGCGGGGGPAAPKIAPARQYRLVGFRPSHPVPAGRPAEISFKIVIPSGATLTRYRTGPGPHTGVDLVIVRYGADAVIYTDTTVSRDGVAREDVTLPAPGRYRVVVDAYPKQAGVPSNFQLFTTITATGSGAAPTIPRSGNSVTVGGYRFAVEGHPRVKAIRPTLITVGVTDSHGRAAHLVPYREALAHAIFIRLDGLDYFHTHVCAPDIPGCTSLAGAPPVSKSAGAGRLRLDALLPLAGTWRLFLIAAPDGHVVTAPLTLHVTG